MIQVSNWFINARVRLWKPMIDEMYAEMSRRKGRTIDEETDTSHRSRLSIDCRRFCKNWQSENKVRQNENRSKCFLNVKLVEVVHVLNMVKTVYTPTLLSQLEVKSGNYCYSPLVFHAILDIETKLEFHGSVQCECLRYNWFFLHSQTNNIPLSYPVSPIRQMIGDYMRVLLDSS